MLMGLSALETTDWSQLQHSYGRATDTPGHLLALLSEDIASREKAISHLWSAIIHQGTPWTATGPAALVVAGFLSDERIDRGEPIRAVLLSFLIRVAEAADPGSTGIDELESMAEFDLEPYFDCEDDETLYENDDVANALFARSILGCIRVTPVLMKVMLEGMEHGDSRVRAYAAAGAVKLANTPLLGNQVDHVESRLLSLAKGAQDPDERSSHVLGLGSLGYSPIEFLEDPSPAVRMCAALAPKLAANPRVVVELLNILQLHAGDIDDWFVDRPPQFHMRPRFQVVARLIEQLKDFDRLVDAAIPVIHVTTKYCVDMDWGPLLAAAFPDGNGVVTSEPQRRFLNALVNKPELWDSTFGNAFKWFRRAGLPNDRNACRILIGEV